MLLAQFWGIDHEFVPMSVEVDGPQVEHGLSAVDGPAHARLFQPIFHHVSAGAFGHAAADGVTGRQVFVVAHVPAVVFVVADDGRHGTPPRAAEGVLVAQPFEASDHIAYLSRQQQPQVVRDKLLGLAAPFAVKHVGRLPQSLQHAPVRQGTRRTRISCGRLSGRWRAHRPRSRSDSWGSKRRGFER